MLRRMRIVLLAGLLTAGFWLASPEKASAQSYNLNRTFYYPYYFFPHNYWPISSPPYPERVGDHYVPPPAYMAFPPFHEPHWRYELWKPMSHYRGFHFWLDQF